MSMICNILCPVISLYIFHKLTKTDLMRKNFLVEYAFDGCIFLFVVNVVMFLMGKTEYLDKISKYPDFAFKYVAVSVLTAICIGIVKACIVVKKFVIQVEHCAELLPIKISPNVWYHVFTVYVVIISIIRIFDMNYWGDEAFSIRLAKLPLTDMIQATAADVHPPLYYILLRGMYLLFGKVQFTRDYTG